MQRHILLDWSCEESMEVFKVLVNSNMFKCIGFTYNSYPITSAYDESSEWPLIFFCKSKIPTESGKYIKFQIRIRYAFITDMPQYINLAGLHYDTRKFYEIRKGNNYLKITYKEEKSS